MESLPKGPLIEYCKTSTSVYYIRTYTESGILFCLCFQHGSSIFNILGQDVNYG